MDPEYKTFYRVAPSSRQCLYERLDNGIIDYQTYNIEGLLGLVLRGPAQALFEEGSYICCLGAAQTFGRFVEHPYPELLRKSLDFPVVNLGLPGAGPQAFIDRPELLEFTNRGNLAIVQVLSARSAPNRYFQCDGFSNGFRRSDGERISALQAFDEIFRVFTTAEIVEIVDETIDNWRKAYEQLLAMITVPKILFYFSESHPRSQLNMQSRKSLFGAFPQLVTTKSLIRIAPLADRFAETVCETGLPQKIRHPLSGEPVLLKIAGKETDQNRYYPSPEMHIAAANTLVPVVSNFLNK